MDRLERIPSRSINALLVAIRAAIKQDRSELWTALPAIVGTYNSGAQTVTAQPTIQAQIRQPNGTWVDTNMPLCQDCPVVFPGGGGFTLTFPIAAKDEGVLVFASRCIDSWWQQGGIQKQAELRMHDLSDGFFIPSMLSQTNKPGNPSTNTCQLRSKDGTTYVEIAAGQIVNINAPGGLNILNAPEVNFGAAKLVTTGNVQCADVVTNVMSSANAHVHGGVSTGPNNTEGPTG